MRGTVMLDEKFFDASEMQSPEPFERALALPFPIGIKKPACSGLFCLAGWRVSGSATVDIG